MDKGVDREQQPETDSPADHPMRGLFIAQFLGAFNDNAWKQVVVLLAVAAAASQAEGQERTAIAQIVLMIPLMVISLPAGVMADRFSKRSVIVAMKVFEVLLMLAGTAALFFEPQGGLLALGILALLGVQAALFSPAKYGILPEILPHNRLSAGNGLLEMGSNLAILSGIVAGGVLLSAANRVAMGSDRTMLIGAVGGVVRAAVATRFLSPIWLGGVLLTAFSACGLVAALTVPRVKAARAEGGLVTTVRIAWESIRADRVLRLTLIGQILVWAIASLVPAPILPYASKVLHLAEWQTGLPLAALGIGIGVGCVLAGKISGPKVEYGLLPLGALGLTAGTLAFAIIGPGMAGTMIIMALLGIFSGLLFVPLNALLQWRAPADRRGAIIAFANVLVYAGMLMGSVLALALAKAGVDPRGTFLGVSIILMGCFLWAMTIVPEAFFRFILLGLAHTLYRVRVLGRSNVPSEGGALLVPNHVSFADGLFLFASTDRPIRFVVYAPYFDRPIMGRFLRAMKAIPISAGGGPKIILHAFREAGRALDDGELVCVFPEGQLTRTGMMAPFQRGLQRIVKGRTSPIIPVHLDGLMGSIFSPASHRRWPERLPYPVTVSFGRPMPPDSTLFELRQAICELGQEAWSYRKGDRHPLHHEFIRRARRHPARLAFADLQTPRVSYFKALAGALAIARALRSRWEGQSVVGILLPSSVGGALVNLAATLAGKTVVNLNFTAGRSGMESAAAQAGLRTVVTSRAFLEKAKLEPPNGLELIIVEDVRAGIRPSSRVAAAAMADLRAGPTAGTLGRGLAGRDCRRHRDHHFQQRQYGRAQRSGTLSLQHRFQRPGHPRGVPGPTDGSADRHPAAVPFVRLHDLLVRDQFGHGLRLPPEPAGRAGDRGAGPALLGDDPPGHADLPPALSPALQPGAVRLDPPGARRGRKAVRGAGPVVRGRLRHPPDGGLWDDRMRPGGGREHVRSPRDGVLSAGVSSRIRRPAVAGRRGPDRPGRHSSRTASGADAEGPGAGPSGPNVMRGYLQDAMTSPRPPSMTDGM